MPGLHRAKCVAKKKGRKEGGRCFPSSRTLSNYPLLPSILHVGVARGDVLMCCEDWCVLTAACLDTDTSVWPLHEQDDVPGDDQVRTLPLCVLCATPVLRLIKESAACLPEHADCVGADHRPEQRQNISRAASAVCRHQARWLGPHEGNRQGRLCWQ